MGKIDCEKKWERLIVRKNGNIFYYYFGAPITYRGGVEDFTLIYTML